MDATIDNAKGVVFNISGGDNLSLNEVNRAARTIYATVEPDANVIFGALTDESLGDSISITVLATGFATNDDPMEQQAKVEKPRLNDVVRPRAPAPAARSPPPPAPASYEEVRAAPAPPPDDDDDTIPDFLRGLKKRR